MLCLQSTNDALSRTLLESLWSALLPEMWSNKSFSNTSRHPGSNWLPNCKTKLHGTQDNINTLDWANNGLMDDCRLIESSRIFQPFSVLHMNDSQPALFCSSLEYSLFFVFFFLEYSLDGWDQCNVLWGCCEYWLSGTLQETKPFLLVRPWAFAETLDGQAMAGMGSWDFNRELKVKIAHSCPTLCDPMDYTVHGILQARILE